MCTKFQYIFDASLLHQQNWKFYAHFECVEAQNFGFPVQEFEKIPGLTFYMLWIWSTTLQIMTGLL